MKENIIQFPVPIYTHKLPDGIYREDVERFEVHNDRRGNRKTYAVLLTGEHVELKI